MQTTTRWTKIDVNTWTKGNITITRETGIAGLTIFVARNPEGRQVARTDSLATCKRAAK